MKISKAHTTMKSILKVKTKSFIENYKQNKLKNTLKKNDINIVEDELKKERLQIIYWWMLLKM